MYTYAAAVEALIEAGEELTRDNVAAQMEQFDGSLLTTHGAIETSPESHRLDRHVDRGLHRRRRSRCRTDSRRGCWRRTPIPSRLHALITASGGLTSESPAMNLTDLSQYFFSGLTIGCIYALVALGFVIIANVTQVYNFAQGEYVMIGAMVVAGGSSRGWSLAVLVPLASVVVGVVALRPGTAHRRAGPRPGEPAHDRRRHARRGRDAARARR